MTRAADDTDVGAAIRRASAGVTAPEALRRRLDEQRAAPPGATRRRRIGIRTAPPRLATARRGIGLGAALAVACTLALLLATVPTAPPSLADAAATALRPPAGPVPAHEENQHGLLAVSAGRIRFPDFSYADPPWRAVGVRRTRDGGRDIVAVTYAGQRGTRVGYAIVSDEPIAVPAGAERAVRNGRRYALVSLRGVSVVTWRQGGRTCVLASRGATRAQLLALAAWDVRERATGGGRY